MGFFSIDRRQRASALSPLAPIPPSISTMSVKLESSDEQVFEVPREIAEMSVTVKHMLDDVDADSDAPIPLPNVTGKILAKVIEWAKYHHANPDAPSDERRTRRGPTTSSRGTRSSARSTSPLSSSSSSPLTTSTSSPSSILLARPWPT